MRKGVLCVALLAPLASACSITSTPDGFRGHDRATAEPEVAEKNPATCTSPPPPPRNPSLCKHQVRVEAVELSTATCVADTDVKKDAWGDLTLPCYRADGEARLEIGDLTFVGVSVDGEIDMCAATEFEWQDGCVWTSAQHVQGNPRDGFVFRYGEAPKPGQSGCAASCTATASLRLDS